MFENQTEPTFGATRVVEPKTSSLRYLLLGWCKIIASDVVKARALENRSETVVSYLLEALEASSANASLDVKSLAKLVLRGDYISQLASVIAEETSDNEIAAYEQKVLETIAEIPEPDDGQIEKLIANGLEYLPDAVIASIGAESFALSETLCAGVVGAAENLRRSLEIEHDACCALDFEAQGLRNHLETLRPKERRERRAEITAEAAAVEERARNWREKNKMALDGIVDALALLADEGADEEKLYDALVNIGRVNAAALETLEEGIKWRYGEQSPEAVLLSPKAGKCVLFMGDDLDALMQLLNQAEYNEVDVWTHGDSIVAHSLKAFREKKRLVGHYGGSWRNQKSELGAFPGGILVASAPIEEPDGSYAPYIFTTKPSYCESVAVVPRKADGSYNMSPVIRAAKDSSGFFRAQTLEKLPVGFGGETKVLDAVEHAARAIRDNRLEKIVVIGGQDANGDSNDYFTRLFAAVPSDAFVISFGDVKFRFDRSLITPTPYGVTKLVDVGSERDANAALRFANTLTAELDREPGNAPLAFFVSLWGETSLAFLLSLCALGYRGVVVGPKPPACWTPAFVNAMRERFGVRLADDPAADLAQ